MIDLERTIHTTGEFRVPGLLNITINSQKWNAIDTSLCRKAIWS